jgi:hypothetical protein
MSQSSIFGYAQRLAPTSSPALRSRVERHNACKAACDRLGLAYPPVYPRRGVGRTPVKWYWQTAVLREAEKGTLLEEINSLTPPDGWQPGCPLVFDAFGPVLNDLTEQDERCGKPVDAGAVSDDDDDVPLVPVGARAERPTTKRRKTHLDDDCKEFWF